MLCLFWPGPFSGIVRGVGALRLPVVGALVCLSTLLRRADHTAPHFIREAISIMIWMV